MMNHITIAARATPKGGAPSAGVMCIEKECAYNEMSDNSESTNRQLGIGVALGTSFGITIGATIGAVSGDVGFWVAMGICFGPIIGILAALAKSKQNPVNK